MRKLTLIKTTPADLELLVPLRLEVLRAANGLAPDAEMPGVEQATRAYYKKRLGKGTHLGYLAYAGGRLAGCGAASLYTVMPTYTNPTGRKAYIMNMYIRPQYRRRGYARALLAALLADLQALGVTHITLETTAAGRPMYERCGFADMGDEMVYTGDGISGGPPADIHRANEIPAAPRGPGK